MPSLPANWPPWLVVAGAVAAAGVLIWIMAKALKGLMWLLLIAVLAGCAIAVARLLFHK